MKRRELLTQAAVAATGLALPNVFAQTAAYPNRPIRLIVPFPAGVSPDVVARLIGEQPPRLLTDTPCFTVSKHLTRLHPMCTVIPSTTRHVTSKPSANCCWFRMC